MCRSLFRQLHLVFLSILILSIISSSLVNSFNNDDWESGLDENEKLALDAIKFLHRQLDDDKDGNINLDESNEFLREELKYERDYEKRQRAFHRNNDNQVTVRELWETWVKSEVHNWTNAQTIEWLSVFVGLPQYSPIFLHNSINGTFLPRLAVNHLQFLSSGLGLKDMIHRQKISLKAQDVVLFGPPKEHTNYVKDAILTSLLVIALGICWSVTVRYKSSQRELIKIMKDMESLATAEKELQDLQSVMEKTKVEHEEMSKQIQKSMSQKSFSELDLPDDQVREEVSRLRSEVEVLRSELQRAEVELQDKCWVPPPALQHWLQLTYELELKTYNRKKQSAERQLRQAKDACDKLKKKRSSLMGAFVSTHGKSIDDVDKAILEAKGSLTEITHELQERMNRWKQIEILANCPIMNNPGLHYLETVLRGYGKASSYAGPGSVISNSQDDIDDDAASSIYCPSAVNKLVSTSTYLMFPASGQQSMPNNQFIQSSVSRRCSYQLPPLGNSNVLTTTGGACLLDNNNAALVNSNDRDFKIYSTATSPLLSIGRLEGHHDLPAMEVRCESAQCPYFANLYQNNQNSSSADSAESNDTVSAPPTSTQQTQMPRSKSVGNMQNLRGGGGGGREQTMLRDSSVMDEENVTLEGSSDVTASGRMSERDRRVKFGMRPELNRIVGETPIRESNGMVKKQNMRNSAPPQTAFENGIIPEGNSEDYNCEAFHSTEKPDLIKLSSYPEVKEEKTEDPAPVTPIKIEEKSNDLSCQAQVTPVQETPINVTANGHLQSPPDNTLAETNGSIKRKVRFSGKVRVLRSISRLVSHGTESLRAHKHHQVHAIENEKLGRRMGTDPVDNGRKEEVSGTPIVENGTNEFVPTATKPRSRLFSSFRSKKKLGETK